MHLCRPPCIMMAGVEGVACMCCMCCSAQLCCHGRRGRRAGPGTPGSTPSWSSCARSPVLCCSAATGPLLRTPPASPAPRSSCARSAALRCSAQLPCSALLCAALPSFDVLLCAVLCYEPAASSAPPSLLVCCTSACQAFQERAIFLSAPSCASLCAVARRLLYCARKPWLRARPCFFARL
jgi:hypothetical protein